MKFSVLFILLILFSHFSNAQILQGVVVDERNRPLSPASIFIVNTQEGTLTNDEGFFSITAIEEDSLTVRFSFIGYQTQNRNYVLSPLQKIMDTISMQPLAEMLSQVEVTGQKETDPGFIEIQPRAAQTVPGAFNDFNAILATVAGVSSTNELSSAYRVRGGNFDENMVFVNGIPVYRPFFIRAAQQEGLSFINPDMVSSVRFSAGGWSSKYGDRLSSVLLVEYDAPDTAVARVTAGLLGGSLFLGGGKNNTAISAGIRYKNGRYLLNNIEVEGQYFPNNLDVQMLFEHDFDPESRDGITLQALGGYARNRFEVFPSSRQTTFGTFTDQRSLFVGFLGAESTQFDILQGGIRLQNILSDRLEWNWITSGFYTLEEEFSDVEGGYQLCRVRRANATEQNECIQQLGVGTNYNFARNQLGAGIVNSTFDVTYKPNESLILETGMGYQYQAAEDVLNEFSFVDSAGFVSFNEQDYANQDNEVSAHHVFGYGQLTYALAPSLNLQTGIRYRYNNLNNQFLLGGNIRLDADPLEDLTFYLAGGVYHQPPFYREMRDFNGLLNTGLLAQSSIQAIAGMRRNYTFWGRPFVFSAEGYYKYLYNLVPYDVDNVRIRYYATNDASGFAYGADFRVSGEFIPGASSWLNLSLLNTREELLFDDLESVRRPSDQRINASVFFQDYLPNNPTFRYNLNLQIGSGLPFGPPESLRFRNFFVSETYRRIDLGFYKYFFPKSSNIDDIQVGLTVINLLGFENEISYLWIQEVSGIQVAVPNTVSARFINLQLIVTL